jgi:DNA-binding NarL/FixJ family response regulator
MIKRIEQCDDLCVCGQAGDADEALRGIISVHPDAVVLELSLHGLHGLDLIRRVQALPDAPCILVLSMHDETYWAKRVIHAGALGYVMKSEPPENIIEALRKVLRGELYISKTVAENAMWRFLRRSPTHAEPPSRNISAREMEVLRHLDQGVPPVAIAKELSIGVGTVRAHSYNIRRKLGLIRRRSASPGHELGEGERDFLKTQDTSPAVGHHVL